MEKNFITITEFFKEAGQSAANIFAITYWAYKAGLMTFEQWNEMDNWINDNQTLAQSVRLD
jgi:hypothetical protein